MTKIIFSAEAKNLLDFLEKESLHSKKEKMILYGLKIKLELIKQNVHYGNPIKKNLIPKYYKKKYGATNLFRVELPQFWRMLYTLTNDKEIEIIAFVLDVVNHEEYNEKFNYKKK